MKHDNLLHDVANIHVSPGCTSSTEAELDHMMCVGQWNVSGQNINRTIKCVGVVWLLACQGKKSFPQNIFSLCPRTERCSTPELSPNPGYP